MMFFMRSAVVASFAMLLLTACRNDTQNLWDGGPNGFGADDTDPRFDTEDEKIESFEGTNSGLVFDPPRGMYDNIVHLAISHSSETEVRYTLDGSDPRTSSTTQIAALPLSLTVDPANTAHRYTAPGVVVRATAGEADGAPSEVATHTYLFLNQVVALSPDGAAPGSAWPAPNERDDFDWRGGGSQRIDYGMDPDVTEADAYRARMDEALRSIPAVSLSTDLSNLFDEDSGIYMNASERGGAWERPCSIELLNPDNGPGFQANAGVRIRGGYSRQAGNPKHAFRFFFRTEYGTSKLIFPLFGKEGASEFDRIDLRTSQNYSWSGSADDTHENTMNRDVFSRDLQRELGQPYTRSRYYHLYINGVYWGLFQSQERSESHFAESYFGGDKDQYDTVKVAADMDYEVEAADGTLDAWEAVWQLAQNGFASDADYYRLEGKGATGVREPTLPVLVDVDNLIDFMLVTFFTGNIDGPCSKFLANQSPNNFYAITNRMDPDQGFVFFAHDNEHSLMAEAVNITSGVQENRVSIGEENGAEDDNGRISDEYQMAVRRFEKFHPQWLHHRLTANAAYRSRFAARAHEVLENGGPLTTARAVPLFQGRADEIDAAIIAESARWGDAHLSTPRTRDDDWLPAVRRVTDEFLQQRPAILISQLEASGLY